jgi:hypothetical protein
MPRFGFFALAVSFVIRGSAAWGQTAQRYPDSIGYDTLRFFSRTDRPWPIPFVYAIAGSDTNRVITQVVIGTLAWGALAWVLATSVKWQRSAFFATLLLGLTPQVIRYDVTILSESLSISFAVLAVAATLHRLKVRSPLTTTWWAISLTFCVLSRPTHLIIVVVCLVPETWRFIATKGKKLTVGAIGMFALLLFGVFTIQQSQHMSLLNLYTVVSSRVISDDGRFNWFVERGMPVSNGMRTATGYDDAQDLSQDVASIVQLPEGQQPPSLMRVGGVELATWLQDNGWRTVVLYLITHSSDTLTHAANLVTATLNAPNGDFLPLENGPMIPWGVAGTWQIWTLILFASCGVLLLKRSTRQYASVVLAMFFTTVMIYLATVHTSGIEHVRHSSTVAAMIRVLGLAALMGILPRRSLSRIFDEDDEMHS